MTDRDQAHLLSGAYALDALSTEEREQVEAALRESEELRGEVVGLSDTAVALGLAIPPVAPPPALRAWLLDAIDSLPQEAPEPRAEQAEPAMAVTAPAMPEGGHVVPMRRRRRRPMVLLVSAAAAVLLFTGGFFVQRTLLEPQTEYTRVQVAADAQRVTAPIEGGGTMTVSWSRSEHRTAVVMNGVHVPSGKVLQLWNVHDGSVSSAGVYQPVDGEHYMLLSSTPSHGDRMAVTVEPPGGSSRPTSAPIVSLAVSA